MPNTPKIRLVQQAYRFELAPTEGQTAQLARSVGVRRFVYNWGLAESQREYAETGRRPSTKELRQRLCRRKESDYPWLSEVSAHIPQQALEDLRRSFDRFFKGLKGEGPRAGFPRFKKRGRSRDSARLYGDGLRVHPHHVQLPRIGKVRTKERTLKLKGRVLAATISREADRWFVSLSVERERSVFEEMWSAVIALDLGLTNAAVSYDGQQIAHYDGPKGLRKAQGKLRRLERHKSRKQEGSANRRKAALQVARQHRRVRNQRKDFLHKLSSELARTKSVIVIEDLCVQGMARNRRLALGVADAGMGELRRQLTYKCDWYGSRLMVADRFYPSSQTCSGCGRVDKGMKGLRGLKQRTFACQSCGLGLDRDENAARNLRQWGLDALADELGIDPLPEDLREVTPDGEEGSGRSSIAAKPSSMKQEAGRRPQGCVPAGSTFISGAVAEQEDAILPSQAAVGANDLRLQEDG